MKQRVISALALWAVLIAGLWLLGVWGGILLLSAFATLSLFEAERILRLSGRRSLRPPGIILALLTGPVYTLLPSSGAGADLAVVWLGLSLLVLFLCALWSERPEKVLPVFALSALLFVSIPWMLGIYALIFRGLAEWSPESSALITVIWVIAVTKFCDVGALLSGARFGKTPLAPLVSPKKTREGALGGIALSLLSGWILWLLLRSALPADFGFLFAGLTALLLGGAAIVSDLLESSLKRFCQVKDSGTAIPGIGGALDLTDSLILAAPVAYLLLVLL